MVLGRETKLSLAELEAVFGSKQVEQVATNLATVEATNVQIDRLGGCLKAARILEEPLADYLAALPEGKITLGFSDYSPRANSRTTWNLALKYKNLLKRHGRNVRLVPNQSSATLSSAAAHIATRPTHRHDASRPARLFSTASPSHDAARTR